MGDPRVAILAVGDELLSGDTPDTNTGFMARHLAAVGARLRRIVVVPDSVPEIARFAAELGREHDVVFVCGGIGPTHDDVTLAGVAAGFDVPLVECPALLALLAGWRGGGLDAAHRRLALVPEGAELIPSASRFPVVRFRNLYLLPGVPRLLERKFPELVARVAGTPELAREFRTEASELAFSEALSAVQAACPEATIGSYPCTRASGEWWVRLVVRARDRDALDRACALLVDRIAGLVEVGAAATSPPPAATR